MTDIIYFSPTGNTKFLAEKLYDKLGSDESSVYAMEDLSPSELNKTDHMVILFSIHGFNPPRLVKQFIKGLPGDLCQSVSLVAVGCAESWVNDGAASGLRKFLESKGYSITADKVIAMPLTFIMSFPQEAGEKLVMEADEKIDSLIDEIKDGRKSEKMISRKTRIINFIGKLENPASRLFGLELHAGKKCVSCRMCAKKCPAGNIRMNRKGKPRFGLKCLMCLRCVYKCPEKAISPWTAKFVPIKGGYDISAYQSES